MSKCQTINRIQNKVVVYIIYVCVYCVYLLCIYKYTHIHYIFRKYLHIHLYICIIICYIIYKDI